MSILVSVRLASQPFEVVKGKGSTFERATLNAAVRLGLRRYTFIAEREGDHLRLGRDWGNSYITLSPTIIVEEEEQETARTLRSYSAGYRNRKV